MLDLGWRREIGAFGFTGVAFDPVSLALLGVGAAGGAYAGKEIMSQTSKSKTPLPAQEIPELSPIATAPTEKSPTIRSNVDRQLDDLRSGKGRESTNLTRRKKRARSYLDDGDDSSSDAPTSYTNTTLG